MDMEDMDNMKTKGSKALLILILGGLLIWQMIKKRRVSAGPSEEPYEPSGPSEEPYEPSGPSEEPVISIQPLPYQHARIGFTSEPLRIRNAYYDNLYNRGGARWQQAAHRFMALTRKLVNDRAIYDVYIDVYNKVVAL